MARHRLSLHLATLLIGGLVFVFVALPIGAMLVRSFVVTNAAPLADLRAMTEAALEHLAPEERERTVTRWVASADGRQRMEATAAAMELSGLPLAWNRKAAFDDQIAAAEAALAALPTAARARVEALLPVSIVMLHRRVPLAFKVKAALAPEEFDALRSGVREEYGIDHYLAVVTEPRLRHAASNSLMLAGTTTTITVVLAFLVAFGINRGGVRGAEVARYAVLVPLVSPPVVIATAAIMLFGRNGLVTRGLLDQTLGLIDASNNNLYGWSGVVVAQILSCLPAAFIVLDNVLSKHDGRLEEAAAIQGAGPWRVFWNVTLPMCQPGLVRAATLVFILSLTDFGNPLVIGKDIPVLAGILYDEMVGFHNTSFASAIAVWLIVPALVIYGLLSRLGRRKRFETVDFGTRATLPMPARFRASLTILTWALIAFTTILYGTIIMGSLVRLWGQDFAFTLAHYTATETIPGFVSEYAGVTPVLTSLRIVLVSAPLAGVLSVIIAFLAERVRGPINAVTSMTVMLPAILPGVVFGIGYIVAFNNPFGIPALSLNGTDAVLILNIMFGHLYVGVLAGRAMLRRLDRSVDEAAEVLGASLVQRFFHVTLPMMRRAAILGTLYVFVDGLCTFSAVVFLRGPGINLASVAIFDTASNTFYGLACAMSVTIMAIAGIAMTLIWLLTRHGPQALRDLERRHKGVAA